MKFAAMAVFASFIATGASAADLNTLSYPSIVGQVEYGIETKRLETEIGAEMWAGNLSVTPLLTGSYAESQNWKFDGAGVDVEYDAGKITAYGEIRTDSDLKYDTTTVGVRFKF